MTNTTRKPHAGRSAYFAGDLGKAAFPAAVALLLAVVAWRPVVGLMGLVGLAVAVALLALVPRQPFIAPVADRPTAKTRSPLLPRERPP